jgi:hypothetical protein
MAVTARRPKRVSASMRLVSRFGSSHHCAAHSFANFGIKGTLAIYDSSAVFGFEVPTQTRGDNDRNFKSTALGATRAFLLNRWTRHGPIRAEHAAVTGFGLEAAAAPRAVIEEPAGVGGHRLGGLMPASRAGDNGREYHPANLVRASRRSRNEFKLRHCRFSVWTPRHQDGSRVPNVARSSC